MPNLKRVLTGTVLFFIGYGATLILSYIIPDLIDLFDDGMMKIILWFMLIVSWLLMLMIIPLGFMIKGLTEQATNEQDQFTQLFGIAFGWLYAIFSLAIVYFTWDWGATLMEVVDYPTIKIMFWAGYTIMWIINILVVPYVYISEARG